MKFTWEQSERETATTAAWESLPDSCFREIHARKWGWNSGLGWERQDNGIVHADESPKTLEHGIPPGHGIQRRKGKPLSAACVTGAGAGAKMRAP
jgi:hypothetical protein